MRSIFIGGLTLAMAVPAFAAPNVTNATQKGSLLIFPDIRVDEANGNLAAGGLVPTPGFNTLVRIQNDGSSDIDIKCYWMDGHKNRVDFILPMTRNQAVWFDASSGNGSTRINPFPLGDANGFTAGNRHPFLEVGGSQVAPLPQLGTPAPAYTAPIGDGYGPYRRGLLACWAVDDGARNQVKWNHLSGTATVYNANTAYECHAYSFYVPTGADLAPVGLPGALVLNGLDYDACPIYLTGQFTPITWTDQGYNAFNQSTFQPGAVGLFGVDWNRLAITGCSLSLNQDWTPAWTKLQFDVWNEEEVKFTGAYECADSWHETDFRPGSEVQNNASLTPAVPGFVDGIDAAAQNFDFTTLTTYAARYRVQGIRSAQCDRTKGATDDTVAAVATQNVGLIGIQSTYFYMPATDKLIGSPMTGAGKFNGRIDWDPEGAVPEGGLR
ncbi:MAG: hypothetical protein AB7I50_13970 [Vicinamibacterales bacterium]